MSAYVREQCGESKTFQYKGEKPDRVEIDDPERLIRVTEYCRSLLRWHEELRRDAIANRSDVAIALAVLARRREGLLWQGKESSDILPKLNGINPQGANISELITTLVVSNEDIGLSSASLDAMDMTFIELSDDHPFVSAVTSLFIKHGPVVGPRSLSGCNLMRASLRLNRFFPMVEGANLSFANIQDAVCSSGHFRGSILASANFTGATAKEAQFGVAYAKGAIFDYADLEGTEFNGALLQDARFYGANLSRACFDGADLENTILAGSLLVDADLSGAKNLSADELEKAFGTVNTQIPDYMERPIYWVDNERVINGWKNFRSSQGKPVKEQIQPTGHSVFRSDIFIPPKAWF